MPRGAARSISEESSSSVTQKPPFPFISPSVPTSQQFSSILSNEGTSMNGDTVSI
jgi:hypothetical protein